MGMFKPEGVIFALPLLGCFLLFGRPDETDTAPWHPCTADFLSGFCLYWDPISFEYLTQWVAL